MLKTSDTKTTFAHARLAGFLFGIGLCVLALAASGDEWPQWRGPHRDGVWKETGLVEKFARPQLEIRWSAPLSNGYSGPTVAGGRVYVTDRVTEPKQQERVHCFDWQTGHELWTHAYDAAYGGIGYPDGPRASVTIDEGRAYSMGAIGHFFCLDAAKGTVLWSKDLDKEYQIRMPIWGIASAPLVEQGLVIVHIGGSDNACLVAFDKRTGQERWRALPDRPSYSPPIMVDQAGKRVLVCWTGDRVVGLDPQSGKLYWEFASPPRQMPIAIPTPVVRKDMLLLTNFYDGSLMLRLASDRLAVEKVWQRRGQNERSTDALQSIISTPIMLGEYVYGVDSYGELRCLDAKTGDRIWESQEAVPKARWATIHFVVNGDRVWMFTERGQLIIARLSPKGYEEISRAQLIQPTRGQLGERGGVCWAHPAFAYGHVFARSDTELVCANLKAGGR
jgi:outer membrane protein assembly factor BamB